MVSGAMAMPAHSGVWLKLTAAGIQMLPGGLRSKEGRRWPAEPGASAPGNITQGHQWTAGKGPVLAMRAGIRGRLRHGAGAQAFGRGFTGRPALIMVAAAIPMAEAALVNAVAPAARVLAPEVTALAPLAVFHDLRWLFGFGGTWPRFVVALSAVVVARSVLDAVLAWLAWPAGQPRPRPAVLLGSGAVLTLCAGLLMSPLVTLTFGVALLPFSWPFLGALPVLMLFALLLSHGGAASWWWRTLPPLRSAEWLVADFLVLSLAAVVISRLPPGWAVPAAGLAGIVNARAWYGVTASLAMPRAVGRPRPAPGRLPIAPAAAALAVVLVIGVARAGFVFAAGPHAPTTRAAAEAAAAPAAQPVTSSAPPATAAGRPAVLEVQGFGSSCCSTASALRAVAGGATARQFSYRGLNSRGQPLPHGPAASNLPLPLLGDRLAAQVEHLHQETGRPVDIVAESEGTLGVYAMLARHPDAPARSIVLLSPIVAPGQVSFPADGRDGGGAVPGYALQAVVWFIGGLSPFGTSGAEQLIDSVDRSGAQYVAQAIRQAHQRPLRWMAVVPLADSLTMPACPLPASTVVVPALHGGLLGNTGVQREVRSFLSGAAVRGQPPMLNAAELVAQAAAAWRMPQLTSPSPPCPSGGR